MCPDCRPIFSLTYPIDPIVVDGRSATLRCIAWNLAYIHHTTKKRLRGSYGSKHDMEQYRPPPTSMEKKILTYVMVRPCWRFIYWEVLKKFDNPTGSVHYTVSREEPQKNQVLLGVIGPRVPFKYKTAAAVQNVTWHYIAGTTTCSILAFLRVLGL